MGQGPAELGRVGGTPQASPSPPPSVNTNPGFGRFGELKGKKGGPQLEVPAHPQHQHPHVCHGQVDLGALAVAGGVQTDPVHLQLPGHVQQLNVRLGRRLPSGDTNTQEATGARGQMLKWAGKCHFVGARAGITASPAC